MESLSDDEAYQALARCIRTGDYGRLEDLWLELCDKKDVNLDALCRTADALAEKGQTDRAGTLLMMTLRPLAERGEQGKGLGVVQRAVRCSRDPEEARDFAIEAYAQAMGQRPGIQAAIELSGIRGLTPLKEALERLDAMLFVEEGDYVYHDGGWGVGRVASMDIPKQAVVVDFERTAGHRVGSEMAPKILRKLAPDDFEVIRWTQPGKLREMASADSAGLVKSVLRSARRELSSKEIKARLAGPAVEPDAWGKWWASARRLLQRDPFVEADGQDFELRAEALTAEQEALQQMRSANTLAQRMAIAIEYLKKSDSSERHPTALTEMALLVEEAAVRTPDQATRLEGAFVIEDLAKAGATVAEGPIAQPAALLARVTDLPAVINGMTRGDYQRRALRLIREAQPDAWPALYEEILFDSPRELWDFILKELLDAGYGARASDACLRVATDHHKHAELYLWLCRCAFADRFDAVLGGHDEFVLFENLLSLLDELADPRREQGAEAKKLLGRGKDVIGMKDFGHLRRIVKECTQDEARRLRDLVAYNRGLSDPTRRAVVAVLQDFHPSIFERVVPKEEELPIYTTPAGLRKLQDEYDKLMSVEMPANQAALGAALGHGDVSDNADLRAAREEQAHLAHRADHLAAQLRRVEVLDRLRVNTGQVSPGTQVLVRDIETDREQTFTVLGPWDADPEQGIISHQASLAQALQGKKIGDVARVELADGSRAFEIVAINRGEW